MGIISRTPKALFWALALSAAWTAAPALAAPISDTIDPTNVLVTSGSVPSACQAGFTCAAGSLTFVHDISDQGFNVGLDVVSGATITIHLTEQGVTDQNNETFRYDIGLGPQIFTCGTGNCVPNPGITDTITLDAAALADLVADGKLSVTISSLSGNFLFADSLLTVQVADSTRLVTNVPEPAPLPLIAAGLAALGWRFRARTLSRG